MQITTDMLRTHVANLTAIRDRARVEADQAAGAIQMCEALMQTLDRPGDLGSDAPAPTLDDVLGPGLEVSALGAVDDMLGKPPAAVEEIGGHLRPVAA